MKAALPVFDSQFMNFIFFGIEAKPSVRCIKGDKLSFGHFCSFVFLSPLTGFSCKSFSAARPKRQNYDPFDPLI
jgi:hypothetical protein